MSATTLLDVDELAEALRHARLDHLDVPTPRSGVAVLVDASGAIHTPACPPQGTVCTLSIDDVELLAAEPAGVETCADGSRFPGRRWCECGHATAQVTVDADVVVWTLAITAAATAVHHALDVCAGLSAGPDVWFPWELAIEAVHALDEADELLAERVGSGGSLLLTELAAALDAHRTALDRLMAAARSWPSSTGWFGLLDPQLAARVAELTGEPDAVQLLVAGVGFDDLAQVLVRDGNPVSPQVRALLLSRPAPLDGPGRVVFAHAATDSLLARRLIAQFPLVARRRLVCAVAVPATIAGWIAACPPQVRFDSFGGRRCAVAASGWDPRTLPPAVLDLVASMWHDHPERDAAEHVADVTRLFDTGGA